MTKEILQQHPGLGRYSFCRCMAFGRPIPAGLPVWPRGIYSILFRDIFSSKSHSHT